MIESSSISFSYHASASFSFPIVQCPPSDALLITGASGKGKTTLLHLLAGILKPTTGSIKINEKDICTMKGRALDIFRGQNIGIVFQQAHFVSSITMLENILLAQYLSGRKKDENFAKELLDNLGVYAQINKKPAQLSMGQLQRVSIARALTNKPKVLLADEPTSSLDDDNAMLVAALLKQQAKQYNTALIIVTHDSRLKNIFNQSILLS